MRILKRESGGREKLGNTEINSEEIKNSSKVKNKGYFDLSLLGL